MTNLDSILKSRAIALSTKARLVKAMVFPVVITFLPRSKRLLISKLQSPSTVILEPKEIGVSHSYKKIFLLLHNVVLLSVVQQSVSAIRILKCCVCPALKFTVMCLVTQLCPTLCSPPGSSVHGDYPSKNTGVGCHVLLQGTFPIQGLNSGLLHCRWILS